jgi:hypothetical protein
MKVRITSKYGEVSELHPNGHTGIDLGLQEGTPLKTLYDGVVQKVVDYGNENIGKGVIIQFENGKQAIYGHMSKINVREGEILQAGETIGMSGNTGFSTGPHLHFGLKENGEFVDPTPLVEKLSDGPSLWQRFLERGSVEGNDYPTVWGWLYEKAIGGGIERWITDYLMALPILVGVGLGVWGLLSMVNKRLATWGVGFVMVLGGIIIV